MRSLRAFSKTMSLPRIQVAITNMTPRAIVSGTHPPVSSFSMLALKSDKSAVSRGTTTRAVWNRLRFHSLRTTMAVRAVVTDIVPVTARP